MSISDIFNAFRSSAGSTGPIINPNIDPATQLPSPNSQTNTLIPNSNTPQPDGTGPLAIPKAGEGEKSPLENFEKLWLADDKDPKQPSLVPKFNIDPNKTLEAARKQDFTGAISAAAKDAASKGDVSLLVNEVAQQVFANSTVVTGKMLESALMQQAKTFNETVMPAKLKEFATSQAIREDNPIFDNPAVAPMLGMLEGQLQIKYPNASPTEVAANAKQILSGFASEIAKANGMVISEKPKEVKSGSRTNMDWDAWFNSNSTSVG